MSSRRTLILIGALVVGAIAALLLFQYVGGIEDAANGETQLQSVVVATQPIAAGAGSDDLILSGVITTGERRATDLPTNAVIRPEEIKGQLARIPIEPGTVITSSMFGSDAALTNSVSTVIEPGMVLATTSVDQVSSVAGLITQGDYVNLTIRASCILKPGEQKLSIDSGAGTAANPDDPAAASEDLTPFPCAASVFQKVRVAGIGRSLGTAVAAPVATPGDVPTETTIPISSDLYTFEVPPEAAQVIALAGPNSMVMTLVRKDYVPREIPMSAYLETPGVAGETPYGADPELQTAGE